MKKLLKIFYPVIAIPSFILLIWIFALPADSVRTYIENSISDAAGPDIKVAIKNFGKGSFFTVYADSIELDIKKKPALTITNIAGRVNPLYLLTKNVAFSVNGKIGSGDIKGFFKLPEHGDLVIEEAEIDSIPYLRSMGIDASGSVSARLNLKNNIIDITFKTSPVELKRSTVIIPSSLNSFFQAQGALQIQGNTIKITSISLEGDKGYARLKGSITDGIMNLTMELMPQKDKLEPLEIIFISKYVLSPGYYVIPIHGPIPSLP